MEYTKFMQALLRYRITCPHTCEFCYIGPGVFEEGVHVVGRLAPFNLHRHIVDQVTLISELSHLYPTCWHGVQKLCKLISGLMKMGGEYISAGWRYLVYWELFFGYVPYKDEKSMIPEVESWLTQFHRLGGPLGEDEYLELLYQEVSSFLQSEWHIPVEYLTAEEWCKSGKWMEGKAGTGHKISVEIGQKKVRTRRMKPLEGVFHGDDDTRLELSKPCMEEMFVIQKSESGKIRPVVKTGNCLNRKMNYLSEVLERGLYGSEASTLFAGEEGNEKIDLDLLAAVRDDSDWCVPLDQGAFDQHQSKKSIMVVFAAIFNHILPRIGSDEVSDVAAALWDSLNVKGADVHLGEVFSGRWVNGLPSGWRWTAVLDTLLNIGSFRVVVNLAGEIRGKRVSIRHHYAQGDDVIFTCPSLGDIRAILTIYGGLGYEVHPAKTYISKNRAEFLRRSYEPWGITGYAARTVGGLRFRNPIQEVPLVKGERLYARLVQWHLAAIRGARPDMVSKMLMEDCAQMGLSLYHCGCYFLTPSSVGGGGLDPDSKFGREISRLIDGERKWYTIQVIKELRPVNVNLGVWQRRIKEHEVELNAAGRIQIIDSLLASWGIREADRVKTGSFSFVELEQTSGYLPEVRGSLPSDHEIWELDHIPVQIRGVLKRNLVQREDFSRFVKPGWSTWISMMMKRVSNRVFQGIMNRDFTIPCVLTDNVGLRYALDSKRIAQSMLDGTLSSKGCSLAKVQRAMLGIEEFLRREMRVLGSMVVLAQ
ncbi:MAG: putative poly-capsid protein [Corcyphos virus 2]|nr:MAG: putative poly-capsid protein [Corcyphos virus 2]